MTNLNYECFPQYKIHSQNITRAAVVSYLVIRFIANPIGGI